MKSINNVSMSASSAISHELPMNGLHANVEDDEDDDVDLVNNYKSQQLILRVDIRSNFNIFGC